MDMRRKVCYQSIIGTRRGCNKSSRVESQAASTRVDFRKRAILATKRLLVSSVPFKYYGESRRVRGILPRSLRVSDRSDSSTDAMVYSDTFDSLTKYVVCAICGLEGSRDRCVPVADVGDLLDKSGIASKFNNMICPSRVRTRFETIFNSELYLFFKDDLIRDVDTICRTCHRQLLMNNSIKNESCLGGLCRDDDELDSNDDQSNESEGSASICPKMCLFLGLFAGSIPNELKDLTSVEESMINIYSAVTNISLAGGKHFKVRGATCYTIINDLTSVAKELPRMPTVNSTAVLRHVNTKLSKEYTYRPNRIYNALNWLKRNNHLYADVKLKWSPEILDWANNSECVDIPFIDVTDEEELEIDEGSVVSSYPGETPSSNPGI